MTATTPPDTDVLITLAGMNGWMLDQNLDGISHEESLSSPNPAGNTLNWVVGHVAYWRREMLELLGAEVVGPAGGWEVYDARAEDACAWTPHDAQRLEALRSAIREAQDRMVLALKAEDAGEALRRSYGDHTVFDRLVKLLCHEAYHVGQTGLLRRLIGREGVL